MTYVAVAASQSEAPDDVDFWQVALSRPDDNALFQLDHIVRNSVLSKRPNCACHKLHNFMHFTMSICYRIFL